MSDGKTLLKQTMDILVNQCNNTETRQLSLDFNQKDVRHEYVKIPQYPLDKKEQSKQLPALLGYAEGTLSTCASASTVGVCRADCIYVCFWKDTYKVGARVPTGM